MRRFLIALDATNLPLFLHKAAAGGLPFILAPILGKLIGVHAIGSFIAVYSILMLAVLLADFGCTRFLTRELAITGPGSEKPTLLLRRANAVRLWSFCLVSVLTTAAVSFSPYDASIKAPAILSLLGVPAFLFANSAYSFLLVSNRTVRLGVAAATGLLVTVAGALACTFFPSHWLLLLVVAIILGKGVEAFILLAGGVSSGFQFRGALELVGFLRPFAIQSYLSLGYARGVMLIFGMMLAMKDLGAIGVGQSLASIGIAFAVTSGSRRYPAIAIACKSNDQVALRQEIRRHFLGSGVVVTGYMVACACLAPYILPALFGIDGDDPVLIVRIVLIAGALSTLTSFHGILYYARRQEGLLVKLSFVTMPVELLVSTALVWKHSLIGASLALVLSELITIAVFYGVLRRKAHRRTEVLDCT